MRGQRLTIRAMLEKTRLAIGDDHYFKYRFESWNCQDFIISILTANNMLTEADRNFIYQNTDLIKQNMSDGSRNRMQLITKLGSLVSHVKGGNLIRFI